jgi:hypothetical protein
MPKLTGPGLSLGASGTLAKAVRFNNSKYGAWLSVHHKPRYTSSPLQIIVREKFLAAKTAWKVLDSGEKLEWNNRAKNLPMTGYNLFIKEFVPVSGASSQTRFAGTIANHNDTSVAWTNPENATETDQVYATNSWNDGNDTPKGLRSLNVTNFGFSIPTNAVILGVTLKVIRKANLNADDKCVKDIAVKIFTEQGSTGSVEKALTSNKWETTDTEITYGGSADLWETNLTFEDINSSWFGTRFRARFWSDNTEVIGSIDSFSITVDYQPA